MYTHVSEQNMDARFGSEKKSFSSLIFTEVVTLVMGVMVIDQFWL